ncbi:MAG TPA: hypothetical protein DC049_10540, partial [Spirochaetia bacterium]|nr:hypothetical protein [Spirochaetia bacterium]
GVILISPKTQELKKILPVLNSKKIPSVCINHNGTDCGISSVMSDNATCFEKFLYHCLNRLDIKKIAYLGNSPERYDQKQRLDTYTGFIRQNNLQCDKNSILTTDTSDSKVTKWLSKIFTSAYRPDLLISGSIPHAQTVLAWCTEQKISIAIDFYLAAFDDPGYYSVISPSITCIQQDLNQLGKKAAEVLMRIITEKHRKVYTEIIPMKISFRESTDNKYLIKESA